MGFSAWESSSECVGSAQPGAKALLAWALDEYDEARNLGIYNCRDVAGSSSLSAHAEGRACDVGMPMVGGRGSNLGYDLVEDLVRAGSRLGITTVIYDRTIWSAVSPHGRAYIGVHPHYDHVHVEITRDAGERLTLATCRAVLRPSPPKPRDRMEEIVRQLPTLRKGAAGEDVQTVQHLLLARGQRLPRHGPDGDFGGETEAAVERLQRAAHVAVDGVVGPQTWPKLLRV